MKTVAIVQARMSSTRLPGKVLMDLAGTSMLGRVMQRLRRCRALDEMVVATSTEASDEPILEECRRNNWAYFRGDLHDVLDRYYRAAQSVDAQRIVRITSDCPIIDPDLVDRVIVAATSVEYASNVVPRRTYPRGLDVEAFTFEALSNAWENDRDYREHVTPYIYRHPDQFRLASVEGETDLSGHRWTVDTQEDLELVRRIYGRFGETLFKWHEVIELLSQNSEWLKLNQHIEQKPLQQESL